MLERVRTVLRGAEDLLATGVLAVMIVIPVTEAIGRPLVGTGIPGAMTLAQHLTLWAAFVGAMLATREGKHLSLSTGELLPAGRPRELARLFAYSVSAGVTALLSFASLRLVIADTEQAQRLVFGIPSWTTEIIMPLALGVMALRLVLASSPKWWGRVVGLMAILACFAVGLLSDHAGQAAWPLAVLLLGALLLGAPVYVAMGGLAMLFFFAGGTPITAVPTETYRLVASPTLPAIPLLTFCGYVLAEGGASGRLVRAYRSLLGWMPGGLAVMAASVCALFTTFTGASGVTILALGGLVFPMLVEEGYPEGFSLGLVTSAGSLGLLFPPSLPVILYGVVAGVSVKDLFIAGLVPGTLMLALVALFGMAVGVKVKAPRHRFNPKEALRGLWDAKWDLALPVLVIAGIFGGFATLVEASALAALYAVLVEVLVFRELRPLKDLPRVAVKAATLVGSVLILLGVAMGFTSYLVDAEITAAVVDWVKEHIQSPLLFLLAINVILLVVGSVVEIYSAIVILAPIVAPMALHFKIDPVHLGVIFLANLELGFLFPPMGLNLFLSSSRFAKPLPLVYRVSMPFLVLMAVGVLIITYVPGLSTGVVGLLGGGSP